MKTHKLWIIFLIIYMKGCLATLDSSCSIENENCICKDEECICKEDCGKIVAPSTYPITMNYTLTGDDPVLRMDSFSGISNSRCYIELLDGQIIGSGSNKPTKNDVYYTNFFTFVKTKKCSWEMTYAKYPFDYTVTNLTDMSLAVNVSLMSDPYGIFTHRPNSHVHYLLVTPEPGYTINIDVSYQNLEVPFYEIHNLDNDVTTGDMVMVGSGPNVLSGDEAVLYSTKNGITKMRIDAEVAHVSLSYNSLKKDTELRFNYSFTRKEEITTTEPTTVITTLKPPSEKYYTFVAINRVPESQAMSLEPHVKSILADIATQYAEDEVLNLEHNVTDNDVAIYKVSHCNPVHCSSDCIAYRYSVLYVNVEGEWVFTKDMMDDMVFTHSDKFKELSPNRDFDDQVCDESPEVSFLPYIYVSVVVVVIGCIISLVVYKAGLGSVVKEHRDKYKKENQERMEDERRRSSGNQSMLGLGNNRDSLTSTASSRRFSMPFPTKDKKSKNNVKYDVSGFKEFNPENSFGGEPVVLGLEKEFLGNPSSMKTYYTNEGYIPDESTNSSRTQNLHWEDQEGPSSVSSSDVEDDGLSFPPLSQSHELARRQLQERLANNPGLETIQASDSEEDNDSDQDVSFNRNPGNTVQLTSREVHVDVHPYLEHEGETVL